MPKSKNADYSEGALSNYSQISTFLAGIFFACLLLLVQQRQQFEYSFTLGTLSINAVDLISVPLTISSLTFLFAALAFTDACASKKKKTEDIAIIFFAVGLFSTVVSIFFILLQISLVIAIFGALFSIALLVIWIKSS